MGSCGLSQINRRHRFANVFYWVRRGYTGQGIARRAVRLLAGFGFAQIGLVRVEILMAVENPASRRVAEGAGAHYEGRLRHRIVLGDTLHDAFLFSLLPSDLIPKGHG